MAGYGLAISASTLLAIVAATYWLGFDTAAATTVAFLTIALAQLGHVFNMRGRGSGVLRNAVTANRLLWYALALCLGLILLAVNVPALATALQIQAIGFEGWALAVGCSLLPLAAGQLWLTVGRDASSRSLRKNRYRDAMTVTSLTNSAVSARGQ
jgi:Ca2+-transporting ATPase